MSQPQSGVMNFLQSTIGQHSVATAVFIGVLIFVIIILAFFIVKYRAKANKGSFGVRSMHNLKNGGNNPLWWHGSGDAGWGGPMHRETTAIQAAAYMPNLHKSGHVEHEHMHRDHRGYREGLTSSPDSCKSNWDPAASVEAQTLSSVGSYNHDGYGESRLQSAINAAYDNSAVGLSDDQLGQLMHQGGLP